MKETNNEKRAAAYARVSTILGQNPENQLIPIREVAQSRGYMLMAEYVDEGVSGAQEKRRALDRLVADAKSGKFKIVIISALDRLGRNTRHLLNLIHELQSYGCYIVSLRESLDFTNPIGRATLTILGAIAELERELIRERIRTALAAKKLSAARNGTSWRCGRPRTITSEVENEIKSLRAGGLSYREIRIRLNRTVSLATISGVLNKKKVGGHK